MLLQTKVFCIKHHYAVDWELYAKWYALNAGERSSKSEKVGAFTVKEERKVNYSAAFPFPVKNKTVQKIKSLGNGSFGDVFLASLSGSKKMAIKLSAGAKYAKNEYNP